MLYLFFDTETTGLIKGKNISVTDVDRIPRMVQLGYIMYNDKGNKISSDNFIIKPEGYTIPYDASRIHGITTEIARNKGVGLSMVLNKFDKLIQQSDCFVAHNMAFDEKVIGAEFIRNGMANRIPQKRRICTMQSTINFCALPNKYGYSGCKYPTLAELYYKLFNTILCSAINVDFVQI